MKIEIKNKYNGNVIYSHEFVDNSIKKTLIKACDNGVDLRGANLRGVDLCGANLRDANLRDADLCDADLCGANLCDADLCGANLCHANLCGVDLRHANLCQANLCDADLCHANLRGANLCGVDLRDADLCDANLCGATGNSREIKTIQTNKWTIIMTKKVMAIGCEQHKYKRWLKFSDEEISKMDNDALEFWNKWKKIIKKMHRLGFKP